MDLLRRFTPLLYAGVSSPQDGPGLASDCTTLLQVRDTLAGSATLNWRTDRDVSDWDGVAVSGVLPRVTGLNLPYHELTGTIPPKLGGLTNLENLDLRCNQLSGPIPPELAVLTNLENLDLSSNQLTGPIPSELASLASLERMDLSSNQLSGPIPPELAASPIWRT